jgi:hypothetical protein
MRSSLKVETSDLSRISQLYQKLSYSDLQKRALGLAQPQMAQVSFLKSQAKLLQWQPHFWPPLLYSMTLLACSQDLGVSRRWLLCVTHGVWSVIQNCFGSTQVSSRSKTLYLSQNFSKERTWHLSPWQVQRQKTASWLPISSQGAENALDLHSGEHTLTTTELHAFRQLKWWGLCDFCHNKTFFFLKKNHTLVLAFTQKLLVTC